MNLLIQHIPHAVPVVVIWGLLLRFWLAQRRLERVTEELAEPQTAAPAAGALAPTVRRGVATRGLLALGPLLGALATGLVIYALNLGRGHAGGAAVWTHVGLSLLALLLVAYKIADLGMSRLRESLRGQRSWRAGGSLVLLVLWVPLLVSGFALLLYPSEASFTAYAHLIASVWWTGLLLWHLRRYLARAVRAVLAPPARTPGMEPARTSVGFAEPARPHPAPSGRPPQRRTRTKRHRGSTARSEALQIPSSTQGSAVSDGESADGGAPAPIRWRPKN